VARLAAAALVVASGVGEPAEARMNEDVMLGVPERKRNVFGEELRQAKRAILRHYLDAHQENRTRAARALGIERTYLCRLIRELHP
jgi:transcriptional regulator with PAS, ATPase and Fis domain